jgi:hypothetical protein
MVNLVALHEGKEGRVKTWDLWHGFGYKEHRTLKMVIFKNREKFEKIGELISTTTVVTKTKGRPDQSYLLNERQFILLVMLAKNTPESVELKSRVENEFHKMRLQLANLANTRLSSDWQQARKDGIEVYKQKRDVIKMFVDYAKKQGSESAEKYYTNLATMENRALFLFEQKFKNTREVLNIRQLAQVSTADQIVEKALDDGMAEMLHYKDIYHLAKERVNQFSAIIGKSQVIELLENNEQRIGAIHSL